MATSTLCSRSLSHLLALLLVATLTACGSDDDDDDAPGGGGGGGGGPRTTTTVAFVADRESDGVFELYAVEDDGSDLRRLSSPMGPSQDVVLFKLSPDGQQVAYLADQRVDEMLELFVVDVAGGTLVRVSQDLPFDGDVAHGTTLDSFWWSPDSARLAYLADAETDDVQELYIVDADGSDRRRASSPVGAPAQIRAGQAQWSPNGRYLAYYVRTRTPVSGDLGRDRIAIEVHDTAGMAGTATRVSDTITAPNSGSIPYFSWSPDSRRIAYASPEDSGVASTLEAYIVNVAANTRARVSVPLAVGQTVSEELRWSNNSRFLLYAVTGSPAGGLYTHDMLNSAPANATKVSGDLIAGGELRTFDWAPNGNRVVYIASQRLLNTGELFSALPDAANSWVVLTTNLVQGGNVVDFHISPDSELVAYLADENADGVFEVRTVAIAAGGTTTRVSHSNPADGGVDALLGFSPTGDHLAYLTEAPNAGIFVTETDNNSAVRELTAGQLATNSTAFDFPLTEADARVPQSPWSPTGEALIFTASEGSVTPSLGPFQLYSVEPNGGGFSIISDSAVTGADVLMFDFPDR